MDAAQLFIDRADTPPRRGGGSSLLHHLGNSPSRPGLHSYGPPGLFVAFNMRITEIFFSIQGESTHAGEPCAFVRFTGCSLRCGYCDTKYSYAGGSEMSQEEVLKKVAGYPVKLVEITGGEPLEHHEVYPL